MIDPERFKPLQPKLFDGFTRKRTARQWRRLPLVVAFAASGRVRALAHGRRG